MVKWGVIGWGNIAKRFASGLMHSSNGFLYAIGSKSAAVDSMSEGVVLYREYERLLENPEIQAVYIGLPHKFHKEWAIKSMEKGKAVLCEKPAALNCREFDEITAAAMKYGIFFMEAMKTPFIPLVPVIRKRLEEGIIGEVTHIYTCFCGNALNRVGPEHYLLDPEQGGSLLDVGVYPLAFLVCLCGSGIVSMTGTLKMHKEVDSSFKIEIRFENGITGLAEGSIEEEKPRTAVISGSLGKMEIPMSNRPETYEVTYRDGRTVREHMAILESDMIGEIEEVHKCLKEGLSESREWGFRQTRKVLEIIDEFRAESMIGR